MGASGSMQYTIGTALDRAYDRALVVGVLVDNTWLTGLVVANDGVGVVLDDEGREHCVVRLERISAVRVCSEAPMRGRIPSARAPGDDPFAEGAMPMRASRSAPG